MVPLNTAVERDTCSNKKREEAGPDWISYFTMGVFYIMNSSFEKKHNDCCATYM